MSVDIEALRALSAAATPGAWTAATAPHADSGETVKEYHDSLLTGVNGRLWVCWATDGSTDVDYVVPAVSGDGPTSEANAAFIAAAVNYVRIALDAPPTSQPAETEETP